MSFSRYPEYKDSGVEWLGEVPGHWSLSCLKRVAWLNPTKSNFTGNPEQLYSFVPMEKLKTGRIVLDEVRPAEEVFGSYTYFEDGDVLQAKVTPCFENKNIALAEGLTNGVGFGSTEINVLRPGQQLNPKYLYYRVQEDGYMSVCTSSMTGAGGLKRVPPEVINNFKVAVPSPKEQIKISTFLDHETAKIDALIQEQQRLIKLLKEKRQAVISHAVTKGLDPSVSMKDSEVKWLGEVPEHWEVKKVGHTCDIRNNLRTPIDRAIRASKTGPFPYYGPTGVLDHIDEFFVEGEYFLLGEDGDHFLKFDDKPMTIIVNGEFCVNNHAHLIQGRSGFSTHWGALYFEARDLSPWLIKQGVGRYKLRKEILQSIPVLVPPPTEQAKIVDHVLALKMQLNQTIRICVDTIELLLERRSALVSAAVTGKIDVRKWRPPADESAFDEEVRQAGLEVAS